MKPIALLAFLAMSIAPVFAQAGPPQQPTITPKETINSVKLESALKDEKALSAEAQNTQTNFKEMMAKFQSDYAVDQRAVDTLSEEVRKENGWGAEYVVDRNPQSPTFGKWVKNATPPPPPPPERAPAKKK
jgi:hypothetical protein